MTLEDHIQPDLLKLRERLAKQGILDVSSMEYEKYLRSTLWENIREWVKRRDNFCCVICLRKKHPAQFDEFDVHHRSYDIATLEGRDESQLITLCRRCHTKIEHFPNGGKRSCLEQKEVEYQRLATLHRSIVENGLPVRVEETERRGRTSYSVTYVGHYSFREFYTLDSLMCNFTMDFFLTHKEKFRIPLPFSADKFRQPSGANIIDKTTNKSIVNVTCSDDVALLKMTKVYALPVQRHLLKIITETEHWHVEGR